MITISNVTHTYPANTGQDPAGLTAIADVSLEVGQGEFVSVVGPSGCGKSTLLSLISGLVPIEKGSIAVGDRPVSGVRTDVGFVFQKDALVPWKTVQDNVGLGLVFRGLSKRQARSKAKPWVERVGLKGFGDYYPAQLSGGMRKRAQLAATMVYEPSILLMDEPFSALDAQTRSLMENDLLDIWSEGNASVLFVTHDLDEAIALADRVVGMTASPGRIRATYEVDIPRPRDIADIRGDVQFAETRRRLWDDLRAEVQLAYARND